MSTHLSDEPVERRRAYDGPSIADHLRDLLNEVTDLFRQEIALARAEVTEKISVAGSGVTTLAIGGILLLAGVLVLLAAAVLGLGTEMPLWQSALIVGAVTSIVGLLFVLGGRSRLSARALTPERTMRTVREDAQFARRKIAKDQLS
jgi:hypothetical protein